VTPSDRREVVLLALVVVIIVPIVIAYLAAAGPVERQLGLLVGIPSGGALGWALDVLLRRLVDGLNGRRRGGR
jgi:hypothetical protein